MAANQKIERLSDALANDLTLRGYTVTKSYEATTLDLIQTIAYSTGNFSTKAILKYKTFDAPASGAVDGLGLTQRVYTPHKLQVLMNTDFTTQGASAAVIGAMHGYLLPVYALAAIFGVKVELYGKAVVVGTNSGNLVPADLPANLSGVTALATYDNLQFPMVSTQ